MSIRPQYVAKILNKEKTIEIRKKFPKDYVGWVYIYCTAEDKNGYLIRNRSTKKCEFTYNGFVKSVCWSANRKVVARFWCDKVEDIECIASDNGFAIERYITKELSVVDIMEKSCLYFEDLKDYLYYSNGYAIHITKLEIFDKPKELWQFKTPKNAEKFKRDLDKAYEDDYEIGTRIAEGIANDDECANCVELTELSEGYYGLKKPPQSWCYVEVAE